MKIALTINGKPVEADVTPRTNLADFLREHVLLTGTHVGCEHGICGACTVEIDGEIARSCITYAVSCDGASVRTIEGYDDDPIMARLRQAFTEEHALQCGYCTPGMLIAARDLVRRKAGLSRAQIRTEMSGNLCRCTGYVGIVTAIERVTDGAMGAERGISVERAWLGPAPGPQKAPAFGPQTTPVPPHGDIGSVAAIPAETAPIPRKPERPRADSSTVSVTVGAMEEHEGIVRLSQHFTLAHPRDRAWDLMSDPQAVARCMPGASLDGPPQFGRVNGRMSVKLGPVAATFAGQGTVTQYPAEYRQVIEGHGGDRKSGSRVSGSVDYRLSAVATANGGEATRVDVVIGYGLTGILAQLGRSGLARDLARHMGEVFAQNLDAQLHDPEAPRVSDKRLNGLALVFRALVARARALFGRTPGR